MSYIHPRRPKRFDNRTHFSQTQMNNQSQRPLLHSNTKNNSNIPNYKRTAVTIDSRHRSQKYTPVTTDLLEKNVSSVPECYLQRSGESFLLKLRLYLFLDDIQKQQILELKN